MNRLGLTVAVFAAAGPLVGAATGEVALLDNGSLTLLEGEITRVGEEVHVRSEGQSIRLPAKSIKFVGATPAEAFQWRRAQREEGAPSVAEHLELAGWALTNGLHAEAALELLAARQLAPRDRRIKRLEIRLAEAIRPATERTQHAPDKPAHGTAEVTPRDSPEPELPRLPEDGLAYFTRRIQPLVLNGCGAGGCHGGGRAGDRFALDRASLRGSANGASTRANLVAIVGAIDLGSPDHSPLLAAAVGPHAGVEPFAGPRREELLDRLASWARDVAAENPQTVPPPAPAVAASRAEIEAPAATASAAEAEPFRPRDEFDPEIFNRRFRTAAAR